MKRHGRTLNRLLMALVFLFLYAPIFVLIVFSFNDSSSRTVWQGFTLRWYVELVQDRQIMSALSTTLLVSPYQNRELICATGARMGEKYGVEFVPYDFRPRFQEGQEEARAAGLYLQKYCGCVYSEEERFSNRRKKELHKLHKAEGRASQC